MIQIPFKLSASTVRVGMSSDPTHRYPGDM